KNIIAIAAGIADGLGAGDNAKAGLITRGLAEITRLGVAAGAQPLTFAGLAGLGDLIATCASRLSRNHTTGEWLARGESIGDITAALGMVVEGVPTTAAACALAQRLGVDLPIAEQLYQVLYAGKSPRQAVFDLMTRAPTTEVR
ncbi:MAG TPA: NAD(P)H-dependent glycerol-3-phosphate dehydrogenase, partial [Dehalococcoidia bacterium]|nr:NAD(P)H-dependent glycerol-3-phosphate dehydrogenase [Dehalococcoidia bacterium]